MSNTEETMHQLMRQHRIATYAISLGLMTVLMLLLQPIPSASAQQLTELTTGENGGTTPHGRHIKNNDTTLATAPTLPHSTKSFEKMDSQTSTRKPHRLIRKPQSTPVASVEPSLSGSSPISSLPTPPPSLQSDNTNSQSREPLSLSRSIGAVSPLPTASIAPAPTTRTSTNPTTGTPSARTIPLASAGAGNSPISGNGGGGGRTMQRLAAEMPGLAQLISPPLVPVVSVNPAIRANPTSLSFTAQQGGGNPTAQTLIISNAGGGTLSWSASDSTTWLSLSSTSGTDSGTVIVSATTGALTPGSYSGTVILSATGASTVTVPVTFTVTTAPIPPAIGASPASFSFTAQVGANPAAQTLTISNRGNGTLSWSASDNAAWLTLSPASGTGNSPVTLTVTTATLTTGSYSSLITLTATGATAVTVPVTLTVTAAPVPPAIGASPTSLSFTAQQGGGNPIAQTLTISNTGGGSLSWSASDNAAWLTLSPASGTGNGTVTLTVATGSLTAGTYSGSINLGATGASSITVPVTFTVTAPAVTPTIGLSSTAFSFTATQGAANPASKTLSITNPGTGTLTWSITDNASWLTLTPASGSTTTGASPVTLSVNTAGLLAGPFTAAITVTATAATNSPQTIPVTLTLSAPTTSTATLAWNANTEMDVAGYKVYQATASGAYATPIATLPKTALSYTAVGLQVGTTYYFTLTAYDTAGNESQKSAEVSKSIF